MMVPSKAPRKVIKMLILGTKIEMKYIIVITIVLPLKNLTQSA